MGSPASVANGRMGPSPHGPTLTWAEAHIGQRSHEPKPRRAMSSGGVRMDLDKNIQMVSFEYSETFSSLCRPRNIDLKNKMVILTKRRLQEAYI